MRDESNDILLEQAASAYRERDLSGRILPSPAWWDRSPEGRDILCRTQLQSRVLESVIDPQGYSSTVHAVMSRLSRR